MRLLKYGCVLMLLLITSTSSGGNFEDLNRIRDVASDFAHEQVDSGDGSVKITVGRLDPRLRLAACQTPLRAYFSPGSRTIGHSNVGVRCDDTKAWSLFVPIHIDRQIAVALAANSIERGQVLTAADIRYDQVSIAKLNGGYFTSRESPVGKQALRAINSGTPLAKNMLKNQRLVRRGERVVLAIKNGSVAVRVAGTALADGRIGERVRVRNLSSKRIIEGTVHEAGVVLIGAPRVKL